MRRAAGERLPITRASQIFYIVPLVGSAASAYTSFLWAAIANYAVGAFAAHGAPRWNGEVRRARPRPSSPYPASIARVHTHAGIIFTLRAPPVRSTAAAS